MHDDNLSPKSGYEPEAKIANSPKRAPTPRAWTFSLSTLLLLMTLAAVTLGVARLSPAFGIGFGVFMGPVWLRTALLSGRRRRSGRRVKPEHTLYAFFGSIAFVSAWMMLIFFTFAIGLLVGLIVDGLIHVAIGGWLENVPDLLIIGGCGLAAAVYGIAIMWRSFWWEES